MNKFQLSNDRYKFDVTIDPTAIEQDTIATEFLNLVVYNEANLANFNVQSNVIGTLKLPNLLETRVLKATSCTNISTDLTLRGLEITTKGVGAYVKMCRFPILESILKDQASRDIMGPITPDSFIQESAKFITTMFKKDLQNDLWIGDTSIVGDDAEFDGFLTLIANNIADVHTVSGYAAITMANVVDKALAVIGEGTSSTYRPKVKGLRPEEAKLFVSSNVGLAFDGAASNINNNINVNQGRRMFGTWEIIEVPELPDNTMIFGPKAVFGLAFSLDPMASVVKYVDMSQWLEDEVRFKIQLYFGVNIFDYKRVTYYGPSLI